MHACGHEYISQKIALSAPSAGRVQEKRGENQEAKEEMETGQQEFFAVGDNTATDDGQPGDGGKEGEEADEGEPGEATDGGEDGSDGKDGGKGK